MWFLVRHGETLHNKIKIKQGHYASMLTIKGVDQAKSVAYRIISKVSAQDGDLKNYKIISSPMVRTMHSSQIIQEIIGDLETPIVKEVLLQEIDTGDFTNVSKKDINKLYPDFFDKKLQDFWGCHYPNGESYNEFYDRSLKFFNKYKNEENLIIVTHGGIVRFLRSLLLGQSKDECEVKLKIDQNFFYCWNGENNVERL